MKNDTENKDVLEEKNALDNVVQVNFTKSADSKKDDVTSKTPIKAIDKSASKQELLAEIERLYSTIESKDAEIKRLKDSFGELLDIEEKKEESIAIHKKAVGALDDAVKEAERIVENAQRIADRIMKNAGDPLAQSTVGFGESVCEKTCECFDDSDFCGAEQKRKSVADEMMEQLNKIKGGACESECGDKAECGGLLEQSGDNGVGGIVKLPGADSLVVGKELLTSGSCGVSAEDTEDIDEFLAHLDEANNNNKEVKAEPQQEEKPKENAEGNIDKSAVKSGENSKPEENKKKGWFSRFSGKK